MNVYDVAIVGGGIAGYSAALTAKNLKLGYLWLGDKNFGKKTAKAEYVRNYPAFTGDGEAFVRTLEKQREKEGILLTSKRVDGIYKEKNGFLLMAGKESFSARAVILATGVELSANLGNEYVGRGVSYCAVCDGALYKNKRIAAVLYAEEEREEVEYLASFASEVLVFSKRPVRFKAQNIRVLEEIPKSVSGKLRVEKITTDSAEYEVAGVFLLGKSAPPAVLCGGLKTEGAHIMVSRDLSTNLAGLFAAGDITGKPYQFIKAAGEGCTAAYSVKAYLNAEERTNMSENPQN
ncbi:MAG: NAD(P)/FAD-dependent oxidoreductase [Clostridia bacterium]|nr:NAD(P)/FAD-dependent oxidoreductase [Clostridia bacterium]